MKTLRIFLLSLPLTILLSLMATKEAGARGRITFGEHETLSKAADLPNNDDYRIEGNRYADIGVLYTTFNVAFIPLWVTKEPRLVAYDESKDEYMEIPSSDMDAILKTEKLNRSDLEKIGFFPRYGGKLIGLVLLALIIYGLIPSRKEKKEVAATHL